MRGLLLPGWVAATLAAACLASADPQVWTLLEPGLEFGEFAAPRPADAGDSRIRVLRMDPSRFELVLLNASSRDGRNRTAGQWTREFGLVAAINASMYQKDHATSVSLMRTREHVNNAYVSKDKTVLAFDPNRGVEPPVRIIDRSCEDLEEASGGYGTLVQSIRMISCEGRNVWSPQPRRASTAAIGTDRDGRILFIHVRSPYSTHDVIEMLLELPLNLDRCMYTEGGAQAQMAVRGGSFDLELAGSFETGFLAGEAGLTAWPVPNVIGVVRRPPP